MDLRTLGHLGALTPAHAKPFGEGGPFFRLLAEHSSVFGVTAGAGVRFTHWSPQGLHSPSADIIVNQVEFLTGFLL